MPELPPVTTAMRLLDMPEAYHRATVSMRGPWVPSARSDALHRETAPPGGARPRDAAAPHALRPRAFAGRPRAADGALRAARPQPGDAVRAPLRAARRPAPGRPPRADQGDRPLCTPAR